MEARPLRYFLAVAEELHFGRAAARLQIAQPSLSRAVRELELQLGAALREHGPRALAELDAAADAARRAGRGEIGSLTVGFLPSATVGLLPALVRAYRAAYPDVSLNLVELLDRP